MYAELSGAFDKYPAVFFDDLVKDKTYTWDWVGHMNGNAVYSLQNCHFLDFIRVTMELEPPNDLRRPFDVSMWRVLHAFPYTWHVYQKYRHQFVTSDFIVHHGPVDIDVNSTVLLLRAAYRSE